MKDFSVDGFKSNDSYVEARCFDDAKGSSASKFYSRQESKNPRKSRYMIKLISRIFRKKFPN